jgi:hypothetical protein
MNMRSCIAQVGIASGSERSAVARRLSGAHET